MAATSAVLIPIAAFGGAQATTRAQATQSHVVVLQHNRFSPHRLVVHRGDLVTWVWRDGSVAHNVTGRSFPSSGTQSQGKYRVRFRRVGKFSYFCTIHFGMNGTIVVR